MTSSKIKRPDSKKQKSKGGRKDAILKEKEKAKKKTLTATAIKKAKAKPVKKKILAKAKPVAKKIAAKKPTVKKAVAKKIVAKKVAPKKAVKPVRTSGVKVAAKKVVKASKKIVAKKVAPKKVAKPAKKVAIPVKRKAVALKKVIKPTNGQVKKIELKAKPRSPKGKEEIAIESSVVSPINVIGEDLHFIPEHDTITIPVTQTEARKIENIFHHKEETAFHQENQKIKNALPSRKTMKVYNRNRGRK